MKRKLKILFIPGWYPSKENPVNGIFVKEHAKAVSLYNEVLVLYSVGDRNKELYKIVSDKKEDGIRTIRVKYRRLPVPKTTYFIYLFSIWRTFKKLLQESWRPDIIHAHIFEAGVPAVILGKLYKFPVIISEHWTGFPLHKLNLSCRIKNRFSMNRAQIILIVSRSLGEAIRSYGIKNKFEVVPNVVDTKMFYPSISRKSNKKKILLVSLLKPIKGISYLLEALAQLRQERGDFVLDIVGDGPNRKEYKELAESLGLDEIVKFYGLKSKEEVAEFMRESDFFVLPSLWENLPCVLIEAMASGLPIIATKTGGVGEIIREDVGILVPCKNVGSLAKAIDYMLYHYQDYSRERISQYAKERFSCEIVGKQLDNIYREVKRGWDR